MATRRSGKRAARARGAQKAPAAPTPSLLRAQSMGARSQWPALIVRPNPKLRPAAACQAHWDRSAGRRRGCQCPNSAADCQEGFEALPGVPRLQQAHRARISGTMLRQLGRLRLGSLAASGAAAAAAAESGAAAGKGPQSAAAALQLLDRWQQWGGSQGGSGPRMQHTNVRHMSLWSGGGSSSSDGQQAGAADGGSSFAASAGDAASSTADVASAAGGAPGVSDLFSPAAIVAAAAGAESDVLAAAAEDSWLGTRLVQNLLVAVHDATGLAWWQSIMLTTLGMRIATLPVMIAQIKNTYRMSQVRGTAGQGRACLGTHGAAGTLLRTLLARRSVRPAAAAVAADVAVPQTCWCPACAVELRLKVQQRLGWSMKQSGLAVPALPLNGVEHSGQTPATGTPRDGGPHGADEGGAGPRQHRCSGEAALLIWRAARWHCGLVPCCVASHRTVVAAVSTAAALIGLPISRSTPINCRPSPCPRPPASPAAPCALQMQHQQRVLQVWKKYNCNPFKSLLGIFVQVRARCVGCFGGLLPRPGPPLRIA